MSRGAAPDEVRKGLEQAADAIRNCAATAAARDGCVGKLLQVVDNLLEQPQEPKYRRLLASSGAFKAISGIDGGVAFLVALGFRKKVFEFREYWTLDCEGDTLSEEDIKALQVGQEVIRRAQNRLRERVEAEQRSKSERDNDERVRREQALLRIKEDRLQRQSKEELRGGKAG